MLLALGVIIDSYQEHVPAITFQRLGIVIVLDLPDGSLARLVPLQLNQEQRLGGGFPGEEDYVRIAMA